MHAIASLNRWVSRHGLGRRVRVRGEVTWANGRQVYVRDTSGSIAVTLWTPAALTTGQHVDVAGFVAAGTYSPTLEDAVVQQSRGSVEAAAATRVSAAELLAGQHDAGLVTLDAEVVNQVGDPDRLLVLKAGDLVFTAPGPPAGELETFEPGTLVSVTGVCRVQVDPLDSPRVPRGFQLLLRTSDDVRLVRRAALSPRRTVQALGLLFTMVLAGLALDRRPAPPRVAADAGPARAAGSRTRARGAVSRAGRDGQRPGGHLRRRCARDVDQRSRPAPHRPERRARHRPSPARTGGGRRSRAPRSRAVDGARRAHRRDA